MIKIYYLAHPYMGDIEQNLKSSINITNHLLDVGYNIFNPLTHSHYLDLVNKREESFWYALDIRFLIKMDGIIMAPNWRDSKGCKKELELAIKIREKKYKDFEILYYTNIMRQYNDT